MFERFTEPGIKVVVTAQEEARKIGNNFVGTEQILLGLIAETSGIGGRILRKYGVTIKLAREEIRRLVGRGSGFVAVEIPFTPRARRVLENAIEESKRLGFPYVGPEHILLGILMEDSGIAITALRKILREVNPDITFEVIRQRTLREMGEEFEEEFGRKDAGRNKKTSKNKSKPEKRSTYQNGEAMEDPEILKDWGPADVHPHFDPNSPLLLSPVIYEYTQNITQMAFRGDVDPVIGRINEVERVLQILSRRRKNNPILLGEPGVGKTAVAEGLALEIIGGYVPQALQGKNIITLDLGLIIAGSRYRGDFEKRLKRVISDIQITRVYILVIDEVHTLVGAGAAEGSLDAANILKPSLARGEFQCIGATTLTEYRKYIEPDAALARRFQSVLVKEPSAEDTVMILAGIRDKYELHHNVQITQNAIDDAVLLSTRYINDRFLPDKAIDIIDEACARVRVGYEMIPDLCQVFEDQIAAICREKDAAYNDKDWLTALSSLREEITAVQAFLRFLYQILEKCKEGKKIWIIRSIQQRYQFTLRGISPLLKEWDLALAIYENQKEIELIETEIETQKKSTKTSNSKPGSKKGTKQTTLIKNRVKDIQELEEKLTEYREEIKRKPVKRFIDKSSKKDKDTEKYSEFEYDNYDAIPKEERMDYKPTKEEREEMKRQREFKDITSEIDSMQEGNLEDEEGIGQKLDQQKQKIDERTSKLKKDIIGDTISEQLYLSEKNKQIQSNESEKISNIILEDEEKNDKLKTTKEYDYQKNLLKNTSEPTTSIVKGMNLSASSAKLRDLLTEFKIPFNGENIPSEIVETVQKKLFTDSFTPFTYQMTQRINSTWDTDDIVKINELDDFLQEEAGINDFLSEDSIVLKTKQREKEDRKSNKDEEPYSNPELLDEESFLKRQKLWGLFSFIIWNPSLQNPTEEKSITKKKTKKENIEPNEKTNQIKESPIDKNQVGIELFNLYKKYGILKQLDNVDFEQTLEWRNLFHETLIEGIGNMIIKRFGYGYGRTNINLLPAIEDEKNYSKKVNKLEKRSSLELSQGAKEWLSKNPKWLTMDPKLNSKSIPKLSIEEENLLPDEISDYDTLRENETKISLEIEQKDKLKKTVAASNLMKENLKEISSQMLKTNFKPMSKSYVPWVFSSDIAGVVSDWTGIPVAKVSKSEIEKLLNIEAELQKRVIGQPEAVLAIAKALRRGRIGLRDISRPIASFLFSGPTGVGKTEVTKALAASYFGGESDMVRFDMSEFMERHTVSKLIGSPPGYVGYSEGGLLTEAVRRKPYVVVLFDEVEKAHPDVFNLMLQVLEDGRLSDSQGRVVDFKNTIIVMTSNLGAAAIQNPDKFKAKKTKKEQKISFDYSEDNNEITEEYSNESENNNETPEKIENGEDSRIAELVHEELKSFFRPEFINRIDEVVVFRKLTKADIRSIASIMLENLKSRLLSKSYNLIINEIAIEKVIEEGFNPDYGARPLRRVITNRLEDRLAATILEKNIEPGSTIWIDYRNNEYTINHQNFSNAKDLTTLYNENDKVS